MIWFLPDLSKQQTISRLVLYTDNMVSIHASGWHGGRLMTWLIAEDEADIRGLIAMMFQVWGHQPLIFENGQAVWDWLDKVENKSYDGPLPELVLMDIRMPGKRGNEIANRMRSLASLKNCPIVLMTAYALSEAEQTQMKNNDGVDQILTKPLPDFEELRSLLHNIHRQAQTTA
nr:MAG: hypothetical protein DIU68_14890 [Chloroflexota bacterium]